jgi:hypothetical protein
MHLHAGEFGAAAMLVDETEAITAATKNDLPPYSAAALAGWRGRASEAAWMVRAASSSATLRPSGSPRSIRSTAPRDTSIRRFRGNARSSTAQAPDETNAVAASAVVAGGNRDAVDICVAGL